MVLLSKQFPSNIYNDRTESKKRRQINILNVVLTKFRYKKRKDNA